jgi:hypothetical protein
MMKASDSVSGESRGRVSMEMGDKGIMLYIENSRCIKVREGVFLRQFNLLFKNLFKY